MKNENDFLMMGNILNDLSYTGKSHELSKTKTFNTIELPKKVEDFQNKTFDEIDLEGQGLKNIIPSNIIDFYTRLENFFGVRLFGLTDILREASNLIDDLYKKGEILNKQQCRNALDNFSTL